MVRKTDSASRGRQHSVAAAPHAPSYQGHQLAEPAPWSERAAPDIAPCGVTVERLRYEEEQAYFNELHLLAPIGYFLVGFDGTILQANLAGAEMLGIARTACAQYRFRSFIEPASLADFDSYFSKALNAGKPKHCRFHMIHARGEAVPVTLLASADGSGQACRIVVERAAGRQAALEQCEERFRRMVHSAQEGIWEIDASATTSFVNPKMASMLGYRIEDMLGRPLASFMDEEGKGMLADNLERRRSGIAERHQFKFIHKDGHAIWTSMATNPIFNGAGCYLGALALVTDLAETRQSPELAWELASFDALTGLPNRLMFMDRLKLETRKADRQFSLLALLSIDLNQFADIRQRHGGPAGDALLVEATRRLAGCMRGTDMLARLEGDNVSVVLGGLDHLASVERVAQAMLGLLAQPFDLDGHRVALTASIGVAMYRPQSNQLDALLAQADQAMHAATAQGGNRYAYAAPELQYAAAARQQMTADLARALAKTEFHILYQPIESLETGEVVMAEALLRWRHPMRGLLEPADFLPFAESTGQIVDIGDWVFRETTRQLRQWRTSISPSFKVCMNQSALQLKADASAAAADGCEGMVIEINESALLGDTDLLTQRLAQYRALGIQIALDDFGAGVSSLSHLKHVAFDYLKIDRDSVARIDHDDAELALCEAIIAMAHKLGLKVVAEGVETALQRALLTDAKCDYAQGYWFAHPLEVADFDLMAATLTAQNMH